MDVSVSLTARWMIRHRGGQLWVWTSAITDSAAVLRAATRNPHQNRVFERVDVDGLVVWFEPDLTIDDVSIGWTLFTGFDITWPGTILELPPSFTP